MRILFVSPPFGNYFPENIINWILNIKKENNKLNNKECTIKSSDFENSIVNTKENKVKYDSELNYGNNEAKNDTKNDIKNEVKLKSIVGSFTVEPRPGLIKQILYTLRYSEEKGGWVNKIGYRNKGIEWAIEKYYNKNNNDDVIISLGLLKQTDIDDMLNKIPDDMNVEINISCPNVSKPDHFDNLNKFLNPNREWCIIKLSPYISNSEIDNLYNNGWRQFHCCNTIPVNEGGLSGKAIQPFAKAKIKYISDNYPDATIIGGGGIEDINDIEAYNNLGSNHFSVSTLLFNPIKFSKLLWNI